MQAHNHPIWSIIRLLILMVALVITLWINASSFDTTEMKTIITMFIVAASGETGISLVTKLTTK